LYLEVIMSKTIRNERTRGWLDKLQKQRETRRQIREVKNAEWLDEMDYIPAAEIWAFTLI